MKKEKPPSRMCWIYTHMYTCFRIHYVAVIGLKFDCHITRPCETSVHFLITFKKSERLFGLYLVVVWIFQIFTIHVWAFYNVAFNKIWNIEAYSLYPRQQQTHAHTDLLTHWKLTTFWKSEKHTHTESHVML